MNTPAKRRSLLALVLLVPAASIGVLAGMTLFPGTRTGVAIFACSKVWLFALPVLWLRFVEKERFSYSPMRNGGLGVGLLSGVAISLLIVAAYLCFGRHLVDPAPFAARMRTVGLGTWPAYAAGALYWILVNAVLEEYVWRWFVYTRCEALARPAAAVALSALFFTVHHFFAIRTYFGLPLTLLCCAAIFIGGVVWSALYLRYRSVWPGYLSHAIVDVAAFGVGAAILFG